MKHIMHTFLVPQVALLLSRWLASRERGRRSLLPRKSHDTVFRFSVTHFSSCNFFFFFFGSFSVAEWNVRLQHCNYVIILEVPEFAIVFLCIICRGHRWYDAVIPCRLSRLAYVVPAALKRIDRTVQEQMALIASRKGWFVFYVCGVTQVCC